MSKKPEDLCSGCPLHVRESEAIELLEMLRQHKKLKQLLSIVQQEATPHSPSDTYKGSQPTQQQIDDARHAWAGERCIGSTLRDIYSALMESTVPHISVRNKMLLLEDIGRIISPQSKRMSKAHYEAFQFAQQLAKRLR